MSNKKMTKIPIELLNEQIYTRYMYSYPHKTAYSKIDKINLEDYKNCFDKSNNSLYFHIPFCETKCGYCNFFSVTNTSEQYIDFYLDAIEKQAMNLNQYNIKFDNFEIGGGTPLVLTEKQLKLLFLIATDILDIDMKKIFVSIKTSPNQTTTEKVNILKENNADRISIGVGSFVNSELKILNRNHLLENTINSLEILKKSQFPILNIDIIYGIPTQTIKTLKYSIDMAMEYLPREIFLYPLYKRKENKILSDEKVDTYSLYLFATDYLISKGYTQFSMRKFSKINKFKLSASSLLNTISLGAGARSYIKNIHTCLPYTNNQKDSKLSIDNYIKEKSNMDFGYVLNKEELKRNYIIKNLLCSSGLNIKQFNDKFSASLLREFSLFDNLLENEYCIIQNDKVILTKLGMSLSDYIGPMFISDEVAGKMNDYVLREWLKNASKK